jgi:hypothetical protein
VVAGRALFLTAVLLSLCRSDAEWIQPPPDAVADDPIAEYDLPHQDYLTYEYSSLPINLPSDMTVLSMTVNYGGLFASQETPSVLGQLVWSWVQYFPILLTLYWLLDRVYSYLLRERVLRCGVVHDREYLALIEQENARRERLRQV